LPVGRLARGIAGDVQQRHQHLTAGGVVFHHEDELAGCLVHDCPCLWAAPALLTGFGLRR